VYQPSRTAIDLHGDLWVANRAIGTQGSVTKIANDPSGCIDRNGNHVIDTSRDVNGDGEISIDPADHEMITPTDFDDPTQYDECVLFTTPVGGPVPMGSVGGRALAVAAGTDPSGPGDIWVGIFHEQKLYKLDGNNGQIQRVNAAGNLSVDLAFGPYGAIVDRQQRVWAVAAGAANLAVVDTATGTVLAPNIDGNAQGCRAYAIGIDGKNRVWLPGWSAGAIACRYDLATDTWQKFDFSTAVSQTGTAFTWGRGIAVDTSGAVYMSGYATDKAQVIRFDSETGAIIPIAGAQFI
jgi:streptogramin lyase